MDDKELLGWAAKAAGTIRFDESIPGGDYFVNRDGTVWMPLEDDGDALRLAVKLEIDIVFRAGDVIAFPPIQTQDLVALDIQGGDSYTATRRAIVRAAAEIGKAMP